MNQKTIDTLYSLAEAVIDLADGMCGDAQDQARARDIACTLEHMAADHPVEPIAPHDEARRAWEEEREEIEREAEEEAEREAERQRIAEAFAAWMTRPIEQPTTPPFRARRVWGTGRRKGAEVA